MKSKYFYNGMPAIEYCKKHPEFIYNNLTKYISVKLGEDPNRPVQEIIDEFFTKKHRMNIRYIINGMNLSRYCAMHNISYTSVSKAISRARKDSKYADMDEEELISMIIDKYISKDVQELSFDEPKKMILKPESGKIE